MKPDRGPTRRNFIKGAGAVVGAAAIGSYPEELHAAPVPADGSRIDGDIDSHQYQIFTDHRGGGAPTREVRRERQMTTGSAALASVQQPARGDAGRNEVRNASSEFFADGGPTCSCC